MNSAGKILLVEDDASIRRGLTTTLGAMHFEVLEAATGEDALVKLRAVPYDAVLMDLNMPGMGGVEACRRARKEFPHLSILVVTVRDSEEDKIAALDAGADDYVTKPFKLRELAARLRAAVRRSRVIAHEKEGSIVIGTIELDKARRRVRKSGVEIRLTPTEFDLLCVLMSNAGQPIAHAKLLSLVWGPEYGGEKEYLRTYILQLRKKIEDDAARPVYLETVHYLGYRFSNPNEEWAGHA